MHSTLEAPSLPNLRWASLNGLPAFWIESSEPFAAGLVFRVGRADETLSTAGVTHLVERLAFASLAPRTILDNATCEAAFTSFHATGNEEDVVAFVEQAARGVYLLETAAMDREIEAMRAPRRNDERDRLSRLLYLRFGATGYGLDGGAEYGLPSLTPSRVAAWARARFTRENAALWFVGVPPRDLPLDLATGTWVAPPTAATIPGLSTPSTVAGSSGSVAFSMIIARTPAAPVVLAAVLQRATQSLRDVRGLASRVRADYLPLDADTAHVMIVATCADGDSPAVATLIVDLLAELASSGPSPVEIQRSIDQMIESRGRPATHLSSVSRAARDFLLGIDPHTQEQHVEERREVRSETGAVALQGAFASAIAMVPEGTEWRDHRFEPISWRSPAVVSGRSVNQRGHSPLPRFLRGGGAAAGTAAKLIIGAEGVSLVIGADTAHTVRFADCVGLVRGSAGERTVIGRDGTAVSIDPAHWPDGPAIIDAVERSVPVALHVAG